MYIPESVPKELTPQYIEQELLRISHAFDAIREGVWLQFRGRAPGKPREGQLALADGVGWNPGSGKGLYEYRNGSWVKL
jgi:hypothetical protein